MKTNPTLCDFWQLASEMNPGTHFCSNSLCTSLYFLFKIFLLSDFTVFKAMVDERVGVASGNAAAHLQSVFRHAQTAVAEDSDDSIIAALLLLPSALVVKLLVLERKVLCQQLRFRLQICARIAAQLVHSRDTRSTAVQVRV
jgi:hypothetical protein